MKYVDRINNLMKIESFSFSYKTDKTLGWSINDCTIDSVNLISGKNASGKTRFIKSIYTLSNLILNENKDIDKNSESDWKIKLVNSDIFIEYSLKINNGAVEKEKMIFNDETVIERDLEGSGKIKFYELDRMVDFNTPKEKLAVYKRDKLQHPFLEYLYDWCDNLYLYRLGEDLGRKKLSPIMNHDELSGDELKKLEKKDIAVLSKFDIGVSKLGDVFKNKIIESFNGLGYSITNIMVKPYEVRGVSHPANILYVEENGSLIEQGDISQGMFRALSLIIQLTYLELNSASKATILIDDIGEGLDFERSVSLIKYVINKAGELDGRIQVVMTTNDRMVMNNIPVKYWIVMEKSDDGGITTYSKRTNPDEFEDFDLIGLNNFNFLSGEYYKTHQ